MIVGGSGKIEKKIFYQLCPCKQKFDQRMSRKKIQQATPRKKKFNHKHPRKKFFQPWTSSEKKSKRIISARAPPPTIINGPSLTHVKHFPKDLDPIFLVDIKRTFHEIREQMKKITWRRETAKMI